MKIKGGGSITPATPAGQDIATGRTAGAQSPAAPAPARDKVEIDAVSVQLAQLEKALNAAGIVDTARVEAIKIAISEGRLRIDPEMVADKLLATVREYLISAKS